MKEKKIKMPKKPKTLKINLDKWCHTEHVDGKTKKLKRPLNGGRNPSLRSRRGNMCCLGFMCEHAGFPHDELLFALMPSQVLADFYSDDPKKEEKSDYAKLLWKMLYKKRGKGESSWGGAFESAENKLAALNDLSDLYGTGLTDDPNGPALIYDPKEKKKVKIEELSIKNQRRLIAYYLVKYFGKAAGFTRVRFVEGQTK